MNRLKRLREDAKLTQAALGKKVGVTHAQIQRLETGGRELTESMVWKLSRALKVHPGELFMPMAGDMWTVGKIKLGMAWKHVTGGQPAPRYYKRNVA